MKYNFLNLFGSNKAFFAGFNGLIPSRADFYGFLPNYTVFNAKFYYNFLVFFNNKFILTLIIFMFYNIFSLYFSNNIVYCMEDINDNVSSPESDSNIIFKKRKFDQTDNILSGDGSDIIRDNNVISSNALIPSFPESGLVVDNNATVSVPPSNIIINLDNAFKYVGVGLGIGSAALGGAKIIKALPPSSRAPALITIAGMATAYKAAIDGMELIYKYGNTSSNTDPSRDKSSILSKNIPISKDISIDSTLKYDDYSIKVKLENDTLTLSDLKKRNSNTSSDVITENLNVTDNDYYTITDSYNINSVLENGDLITIFNNNPYLKLEGVLFFTLSLMLYSLIALTIINILSKYGNNLNNYFKNKYILMYINLNRKYLNILTWVWIAILFFGIVLCLAISYVLIDTYDMYCIQSPY